MGTQNLRIVAYWGSRQQQQDHCAEHLLQYLKRLADRHDLTAQWYLRDWSSESDQAQAGTMLVVGDRPQPETITAPVAVKDMGELGTLHYY